MVELTGFDRDRSALLVRASLVTLGIRITAGEAADLAVQLPDAFAACLQHESEPARFKPAASNAALHASFREGGRPYGLLGQPGCSCCSAPSERARAE